MGKKALRFGVSEALLVSAVGAVSAGCFLFEQTEVTSNPAPECPDEPQACGEEAPGCPCYSVNPAPDLGDMSDMSDMCPNQPVECGLADPSCPCYTVNPGPDLPDMVDEASMDDMSDDMSEDISNDMSEDIDGDQGEDMAEDMPGDM